MQLLSAFSFPHVLYNFGVKLPEDSIKVAETCGSNIR